ncbi:GNAT family N-acetyltransferase [Pontibacter chitinilyticus]|uniref:GNAT family N-acetyltransferase n=1 Tax=Pontibacter chitinilyticus TaxID=2674989 RepID=UPI00321B1275
MFLSSDHTSLRALEPADLDFLYTLENDTSVWQAGNTLTPYSRFVLEQYLENATLDIYTIKQLRLVICRAGGEPVGAIDLFDFDPLHRRAGIGIVVAAAQRSNGHAGAALALLLQYCRQTLQLHQVYCTVSDGNKASIHLFQKHGFTEVGVRKDWLKTTAGWRDAIEFQCLL